MLVIDWTPNGQGGLFANVLYDHDERQRWIWNGEQDRYVKLLSPDQKAATEEMKTLIDNKHRYTDQEFLKKSEEIRARM